MVDREKGGEGVAGWQMGAQRIVTGVGGGRAGVRRRNWMYVIKNI